MNVFKWICRERKKEDRCSACAWYYPENGCCQLKKCAGYGCGYVSRRDRRKCKAFKPKPIGKVTEKEITDDGIRIKTEMAAEAFDALSCAARKARTELAFWADNSAVESFTPNELREVLLEPQVLTEIGLEERGCIRCEYCGRMNAHNHRICDGCGAVL
jgi:hypothetical protein